MPSEFTRPCPTCDSTIEYASHTSCKIAERGKKSCRECVRKRVKESWTPECKLAESQRMKARRVSSSELWLNEESVRKKSESLKLAHSKPDAPWKTPEWRAHQSWIATQQALSGTHPFQLFTPEKVTEMAQKSRATNMMPGSKFQQHVAWRNTDEGHVWLSDFTKKSRAENPVFQSDEYKKKICEHLTQARKLVKQSHSSKHERALAEALHEADHRFVLNETGSKINVGPYHPDIIDVEQKIVIEFYGDYSHSHPDMYPDDVWNALRHKTAREVREFDAKRTAFIESQGWKVIIIWESEWKTSRENVIKRIVNLF